ncbi:glycosyltransferase family 8 protein [Sodalis sp. RH19]|uniref:glycosyltransferase family 8 protein n=1 Tax=unclassified Sodalis (in: enterobacteria) TaxID=2636512 RepID=UPI0039B6BAFB
MKAWITLLTDPAYLAGVRTLHQSLQDTHTRYPLVVMVTAGIGQQIRDDLAAEGCDVRAVTPLRPRDGVAGGYAYARFAEVWSKLCAWRLTGFSRLVLLDADMLALKNMDELFDIPLPAGGIAACHACRCNPNHIATYPKSWVPANCYYTYSANPAALPADFTPYFNSGIIVLTPGEKTYDELAGQVAAITDLAAYPFPEQDLLNAYFQGRWLALPYGYNALKTLSVHHAAMWRMPQVKNLHFILDKPWQYAPDQPDARHDPYYPLIERWWMTYRRLAPNSRW